MLLILSPILDDLTLSAMEFLLRQDLHTLFDRGYLTVTDDYHIEVSRRIKDDYGNGHDHSQGARNP